MASRPMETERDALAGLLAEYEGQGYEVLLQPRPDALPDFLRDYQPDAVVRARDETIVVEVARAHPKDAPRRLQGLAEEISKHPGWRLQVVLAASEKDAWLRDLKRPTIEEIKARLNAAGHVYEAGDHAAALLLLWSLLEAAARHCIDELNVERARLASAIALSKDLVSFGFVEQKDYDRLSDIAALRNAVAHGFPTLSIERSDFDYLRSLVERLIESIAEPVELAD